MLAIVALLALPRLLLRLEQLELVANEMRRTHHVPSASAAEMDEINAWAASPKLRARAELSRLVQASRPPPQGARTAPAAQPAARQSVRAGGAQGAPLGGAGHAGRDGGGVGVGGGGGVGGGVGGGGGGGGG